MSALLSLIRKKGQFLLFVGGPDIGKTHMLRAAANVLNREDCCRVVIVDARSTGSDLSAGIANVLSKVVGDSFIAAAARHLGLGGVLAATLDAVSGSGGAFAALSAAALAKRSPSELVDAFIAGAQAEGRVPVIIVDEANRVLVATGEADATTRTRDTLALLTRITKQERSAVVVLAASSYSEQSRLEKMGFRTDHLTKVIVASEVPPREMLALLRGQWGCGPRLATALASVYGGLVWRTYQAVLQMALPTLGGHSFEALAPFSAALLGGAADCMSSVDPELKPRMASLLRAIAVDGFAPLELRADACAAVISDKGVGGVVARSAYADCVPPRAWSSGRHAFVLVPSSQSVRLLLCASDAVQGAAPLCGHLPLLRSVLPRETVVSRQWWDDTPASVTAHLGASSATGLAAINAGGSEPVAQEPLESLQQPGARFPGQAVARPRGSNSHDT